MAKQLIWKSYSLCLKLTTFSYFQILPKKKIKWQLCTHEVYSLFLNSSTGNQLFWMNNFLNWRAQIKQYPTTHRPLKNTYFSSTAVGATLARVTGIFPNAKMQQWNRHRTFFYCKREKGFLYRESGLELLSCFFFGAWDWTRGVPHLAKCSTTEPHTFVAPGWIPFLEPIFSFLMARASRLLFYLWNIRVVYDNVYQS